MNALRDYGKTCRFRRGQIWMVGEDEELSQSKIDAGVNTICRTRPYLIVSSEAVCAEEHILQGYPLTKNITRTDGGLIVRVPVEGDVNESLILLNQLTPIETRNIQFYIASISDKTLDRIDKITMERSCCGEKYAEIEKELKNTKRKLEEFIKKSIGGSADAPIVDEPSQTTETPVEKHVDTVPVEVKPDATAADNEKPARVGQSTTTSICHVDARDILLTYAKKSKDPIISQYKNKPNNKIKLPAEKDAEIFRHALDNDALTPDQTEICDKWIYSKMNIHLISRQYRIWTIDTATEYLNDMETLSKEAISLKWGYRKDQLLSRKYYCQRILRNL